MTRARIFECFMCKKKLTEGKDLIGLLNVLDTKNCKHGFKDVSFCSWKCLGKCVDEHK